VNGIVVVPANEASFEDLQTVFGSRGIRRSVWAVTCFVVRAGFRKRGVGRALARAAVDFARECGARAIEGYPMTTKSGLLEELHVGTDGMFAGAGFAEVGRPTLRRAVMRIDF